MRRQFIKPRIDANQEKDLEFCVNEAKEVKTMMERELNSWTVEQVQDTIEKYLIKKDELDVFKQFTFYRAKRAQDRVNPWSNNDDDKI